MSVRVCVLASGSRGNSTWIATDRTCLLVDAGLSRKETYARLRAVGEDPKACRALLVSHEHADHINGLRVLALDLEVPICINSGTRAAITWDPKLTAFETFCAGAKFTIGDIEVTPFSIPHDAADPVAFTFESQGVKIGVVTDLGYIPELVKQHVKGCHCLIFESNHDLDMLKVGPYPWHVKQRVMSRQGHLSNRTTAEFLTQDYDGQAQVLVLAHLSEANNHPEIARLTALEALERRTGGENWELHLASQVAATPVFRW
ncbi:MAG TPA: MBL fold metallo-hydrolase [Terriglobia bacterium]|nr:MBL fold metallo-hydrolase [Terriglobia bacterium]